jgi:V8-like Glu-specific endopeptidase
MRKFLLVLLLVPLAACSGELDGNALYLDDSLTADEFSVQEQPLIGGTVTLQRPEISRLYFGGGSCTATLISDRALITAKHCVNYTSCSQSGCGRSAGATIQFETATGARRFFEVDRWVSFDRSGSVVRDGVYSDIQYTDTRRSDFYLNDDVALLLLEQPVPGDVATPSTIADTIAQSGDPLTVWGYGCTRRGGSADGNKRFKDFSVGTQANALCPGDSGGPVTRDRNGAVTFVNSAYLQSWRGTLDIYGDVTRILPSVEAVLSAWGETMGGAQSAPSQPTQPTQPEQEPQQPTISPLVFSSSQSFAIPDRSSLGLSLRVDEDRVVDGIDLTMSFAHPRPIDLAFVLRAPSGNAVVLQRAGRDSSTTRGFSIDSFDGESATGSWRLEIYDVYGGATGSVTDIELVYN